MKYLIELTTYQEQDEYTFRWNAGNIVTASQFIADTHHQYHEHGFQVGRDYNITLLTDNGQDENFDNNGVTVWRAFPIPVKLTT